jgi:hypothetical protein
MNQTGRANHDNGPTIEGRIPARPETPFEECYQFVPGKMGYRRAEWSGGQFTLELNIPGTYRVYAWMEGKDDGEARSCCQTCVFEILSSSSVAPSVSMGC